MINTTCRLAELLENPVVDEVPKGWKTLKQLCDETGMGEKLISKLLKEALESGAAKKALFRIKAGEYQRPIAHFFVDTKKKRSKLGK